ncbi:MAG TPA: ABC transporter substrate-binding protein [Acidimicrobiales bacterium]|nr:ABC transporter substrate-binding protein [Acidimicrobiales bacterium]
MTVQRATNPPATGRRRARRRRGAGAAVTAVLTATVAVGAASLAGAAPASSHRQAAESFTLNIGTVLPLSGSLSAYGPSLQHAADLAILQVNAALEKDKIAVKLDLVGNLDDATEPATGVEAAQKLATVDGANVIIGSMSSAVTERIALTVAVPDHVLLVSPTSSDPAIKHLADDHLLWTVYPTDDLQGRALATAVASAVGAHATVNVLAQDDAYGEGVLDEFTGAWKAQGGKVGVAEAFDPTAPSFNSVAEKYVSGSPAAYVLVAYPSYFQRLAPALVDTGVWSPAKTFATEDLDETSILNTVSKKASEGLRGTAGSPPVGPSAAAFEAYFKANADKNPFTGFEGTAFDAVVLSALAAVKAHSSNPLVIRNAMVSVSGPAGVAYSWRQLPQAFAAAAAGKAIAYHGAWGEIDWAPNGTPNAATYVLWKYENGTISNLRTFQYGPKS